MTMPERGRHVQHRTDHAREERAHQQLTLCADVEQTARETQAKCRAPGKSSAVVATSVSPIWFRPPSEPAIRAEKPSTGVVPATIIAADISTTNQRTAPAGPGKFPRAIDSSSARHHAADGAAVECFTRRRFRRFRRDTSRECDRRALRISSSSNEIKRIAAPSLRA